MGLPISLAEYDRPVSENPPDPIAPARAGRRAPTCPDCGAVMEFKDAMPVRLYEPGVTAVLSPPAEAAR